MIFKEERHSKVQRKAGISFQRTLSVEQYRIQLIIPAVIYDSPVKCWLPGSLLKWKVFIGSLLYSHSLHRMYQNIILPKGKQIWKVNNIICINSLGTVSHSHYEMGGTIPKFRFLDSSQGSTKQACQWIAVKSAKLTLSCTEGVSALYFYMIWVTLHAVICQNSGNKTLKICIFNCMQILPQNKY